jgi:hypothetical protein
MPTASPAPEGFLPGGSSKGFVVSALTGFRAFGGNERLSLRREP